MSLAAFLIFLLASPSSFPQNSPAKPTFQASAHLVQLRAIVRDKDGPITDLTKDDFILVDRGTPREIRIFAADALPAPTKSPLRTGNTFSDLPQYGADAPSSISVVLLDNLNTLYGSAPQPGESTPYWFEDLALANAKTHLIQFVEHLNPGDRVALYGLSDSLHVLCDFTSDREQLLAILKQYDPSSKTNRGDVEPGTFHLGLPEFNGALNNEAQRFAAMTNTNRARVTMAALTEIAGHLAHVPGRKNLVWLTANLPFSGEAMARVLNPAQIAAYMIDARGLLTSRSQEEKDGTVDGDALALGHFAPAASPEPIGIGTMRELAEATGGKAFVNNNDLTGAIREAVEESNVGYTLGFYVDPESLDGKFHEFKLEVKRKGTIVRYPKGYFAVPDAPPASSRDQERQRILTAVQSPLQSSAVLLQARLDRVSQPRPNSFAISSSIDIRSLQFVREGDLRKGQVEVYIVEQDQTGKVLHQSAQALNLRLTEKQYSDYLQSGVLFRHLLQPQPGATTLRLLVQDTANMAIGSLIIPLSEVK